MALKVCNTCTARFSDGENCPECIASGRGEIRDYHFQHEEADTESTNEESLDIEIPDDEVTAAEDAYDQSHADDDPDEDLSEHSRNRLSKIASERGLDPSGTKAELLDRLQESGQG